MLVKTGAFGALAAGGLWAAGVFEDYPKIVDGSPEAVMSAFADLDIREVPGEPGTDAALAGGVTPRIQLARTPGQMEWTVYSGAQVATRMLVTFEAIDGGAKTRITPSVVRGDAPAERISPAFRETGTTLALLKMALETELNEMTAPTWGPHCDKMEQEILWSAGAPSRGKEESFGTAFQTIGGVAAGHAKLIAAGCNPDARPGAGGGFRNVTSTMTSSGPAATAALPPQNAPQFVPGKPMLDTKPMIDTSKKP